MSDKTVFAALDDEYVAFVEQAWADPRDFYARLRDRAPVLWTSLDHWFVGGYEEAKAVWKDNDGWSQRPVIPSATSFDLGAGPASVFFSETILSLDGAAHRRMREPLNRVFAPRGIGALTETVRHSVEKILDTALEKAGSTRRMEFVRDFAQPLPTMVILQIFGLDEDAYGQFTEVADLVIECYEAMGSGHFEANLRERADIAMGRCADFILATAKQRRDGLGDDLLSQLIRVQQAEPDRLTDSELSSLIMFLVTAGFETTMNTATNMIYHLLRNPDQLALVRDDRSLSRGAVEEVLRYEPGVYISSVRYATCDMELAGQNIKRGDKCLISNHCANHDPKVFADPHRFDVTRTPNRHLSFGLGQHTCLGAHLARLELLMTLDVILDRLPTLKLDQPEVRWNRSHVLRGPLELHVTW